MLKTYKVQFNLGNLKTAEGIGFFNARNTEELEELARPFSVKILSVCKAVVEG